MPLPSLIAPVDPQSPVSEGSQMCRRLTLQWQLLQSLPGKSWQLWGRAPGLPLSPSGPGQVQLSSEAGVRTWTQGST